MNSEPKPAVPGYPAPPPPPPPPAAVAGGAAYPYPYPAPPLYYPPPPQPRSSLFLRRLVIVCVVFFLLFSLVTFVTWLVLRFRLPDVAIASASLSSFRLSPSLRLSADLNFTFSLSNRNRKMGIFYDKIDAAVFLARDSLSETSLPPFYQEPRNSSLLTATVAAVDEYVDPDVGDAVSKQRSSSGSVEFEVRMVAWVRFRSGGWKTRSHVMRALCDNVVIVFSNSTSLAGSLQGPPRPCRVEM
ncbi:NDR1/HIN1-like protein 26 [Wolffia australiana]